MMAPLVLSPKSSMKSSFSRLQFRVLLNLSISIFPEKISVKKTYLIISFLSKQALAILV